MHQEKKAMSRPDTTSNNDLSAPDPIKAELDLLTIKKLKVDIWKVRCEVAALVLGLIFVASFSAGGALLFTYFLRKNFSSGGLSVADTLSFSQLSFGFSVTVIVMLMYGTVAGYPIARVIVFLMREIGVRYRRRFKKNDEDFQWRETHGLGTPNHFEWQKGQWLMMIIGVFALLLFGLVAYEAPTGLKKLSFVALCSGILLSLSVFGKWTHIYCPWKAGSSLGATDSWFRRLPQKTRDWAMVIFVCMSMIGIVFGQTQDTSLIAVGIRKQDVALQLNKEDFARIVRNATRAGIVVNKCESIDLDYPYINHVDIQWHKFGTLSLLSLPAEPFGADNANEKSLNHMEVELNNSAFTTIKSRSGLAHCDEFLSDYLFDLSGNKLTPLGIVSLKHDLSWISSLDQDTRLRISAYTSSTKVENTSKYPLTTIQANVVKNYLTQAFGIDSKRILVEGLENNDPKQACEKIDDTTGKKLCEKTNRRITVSVI